MRTPFALLLTGKPNSGKTTLAYALTEATKELPDYRWGQTQGNAIPGGVRF